MVIDQFIATSEKKWARTCGFVTMIPYTNKNRATNMNTYMDRLLSNLSDDFNYYQQKPEEWSEIDRSENYKVCNITTPADYFHLIRSQVKNNYRKPLFLYCNQNVILNTSSSVDEFVGKTQF